MYSPPTHTACTVKLLREGEESANNLFMHTEVAKQT
jgi:hypothetical protein